MRRIFLSLLIGIMCINSAHAVHISGRVILADDNEPATRATISFYDNDHNFTSGAIANDNGEFNTNPPNTAQTAEITYVGYTPQTFSVSDLQNKTVTLQPAENMLDEVTVVGHRSGDGCDNEENNRISPELALCSVHVYNIGEVTNPSGADRQLMKDVIALKTTVITQQMNKQYEYMDSMIRRFKTQLEKAVLTTKLQTSGATK